MGIPYHYHTREYEIFRGLKGEIEFVIDGKSSTLKAGDSAFAPRNVPHSWKVVGTEQAVMTNSAFLAGIESMFKELNDLPKGPPDFDKVAEICAKYGVNFT